MITYVRKSNADKYSALYERATEDLMTHTSDGSLVEKGDSTALIQSEDDAITCLEDYFSFIVELNKINSTYTILPLDEDVFTIDANTRQITVPASFAQNGISIQGDEISEIVYFKINRFYDAIDLATKNIYIQWTAPSGEKGVSVPWVIDIESEPNFIIFGWPLSSAITAQAGNVTFAVRFYSLDENTEQVNYSLATLTQTAVIKPSLNFDLENLATDGVVIDNANALITDRLVNTIPSDSTIEAAEPEWIINLKDDPHVYYYDAENHIAYANLDISDEHCGFKCKPFTAKAQAIVSDAGNLSYAWQARNLDDVIFAIDSKGVDMIETTDTERVEGKLYYYKMTNESGQEIYKLYSGELDENSIMNAEIGGVVYEKLTSATVGKVGKYVVSATNRVRHAMTKVQSDTLIIPWPVQPVITTDVNAAEVLEPGKEYEVTLKVVADIADRGDLRYYWYRKTPGTEDFVIQEGQGVTGGYEVNTFKIKGIAVSGQDEEGNDITYIVDEDGVAVGDGYYYCVIENNINGERETIDSAVTRVSHPATAPVVEIVGDDAYTLEEIQGSGALRIEAHIPAESGEMVNGWRTENDTLTYQWCRYYAGNSDLATDIDKAARGEYTFNHDLDLSKVEGLTEEQIEATRQPFYDPTEAGYYFCLVTNTYNGTVASKISRFFSVANA